MEVHHHAHTASDPGSHRGRKKWTHYLWEFLMLFLAVFCGFLAEYQLEHTIEHQREKQYMQSLLTDIREDTTEIRTSISAAQKAIGYEDSVIFYLYNNPPGDFLPAHFLDLDLYSLLRLKIVFNEATAQQLKNSGNLRLIRHQALARETAIYWSEQENTKIDLGRYLEYRNRGRQFAEKLFAFSDYNLVDAGLIKTPVNGFRVIQNNPVLWSEYSNIISHCHITVKGYLNQLKKLLLEAEKLILMLKKEYHLK